MPRLRATVPIVMSCGHTTYFTVAEHPPPEGGSMYCLRHMMSTHRRYESLRDSEGLIQDEYRWSCKAEKCRCRMRRCGQSRWLAVYEASKHARAYPRHFMQVIEPCGNVIEEFGQNPDEYVIPGMETPTQHDQIPF